MSLESVTYCKIIIFNCKPDLPPCIFQEAGRESLEKCKDPDQEVQEGIDSPGSSLKHPGFEKTVKWRLPPKEGWPLTRDEGKVGRGA